MKKFFGILFVLLGMGTVYAQETAVFIGLRKEVPIEKTATNITVISEDEIKKSNAKNAGELIENKVGITDVSKYGTLGSESTLRIRSGGASAQQVLVMVDGRLVNDTSLGSANLTEIPSENIERIEILRGPASALYGANALGGVVNIITKKATAVKPKTEIGIEQGSFNTQNYKMNFTAMPGKANIFLSGGKNITDGFRDNSDYDATNFSAKIGYDFEKYGELSLSNGFLDSELGVPGSNSISIEEYDNDKEKNASLPNANQKDEKFYNQLEHKLKINETELKTKIYQDYRKRHYKDPDSFIDTISKPKSWGIDSQVDTVYDIVLGVEKRFEKFVSINSNITTIDRKRENFATFAQKSFNIDKLTLTPGIRYDYNSVYKESTNPRLSVVYKLTDEIKLSANVGKAFCAPTFEDLYSPWGGNPNLKPQKSIGTDFGIEYKFNNVLVPRVTLFYSDVKDFIEWEQIGPGDWDWASFNKDVFSRGIELEIENKIIETITQNLNYTFLESKGKKETGTYEILQYTPKQRLNYFLNYIAPAEIKTKLSVEYTHKQEWDDYYKHKLPGYTLANFRISRKILQSEVYLSCENIFNKRYVSREDYPLPGRTYSAGINMYLWD